MYGSCEIFKISLARARKRQYIAKATAFFVLKKQRTAKCFWLVRCWSLYSCKILIFQMSWSRTLRLRR